MNNNNLARPSLRRPSLSPALEVLLAADERAQALVLLAAGGAAGEVGAQPGNGRVGVGARELELDVPVELVEALVAADLGRGRAEQAAESLLQLGIAPSVSSFSQRVEREPGVVQMSAQLAPRVVQRLVERAARRAEPLREHVDRDAVQSQGDEDAALVRRQHLGDRPLQRGEQLALLDLRVRLEPAPANRLQLSGSSGTSRPCQARLRSLTAASSSANL